MGSRRCWVGERASAPHLDLLPPSGYAADRLRPSGQPEGERPAQVDGDAQGLELHLVARQAEGSAPRRWSRRPAFQRSANTPAPARPPFPSGLSGRPSPASPSPPLYSCTSTPALVAPPPPEAAAGRRRPPPPPPTHPMLYARARPASALAPPVAASASVRCARGPLPPLALSFPALDETDPPPSSSPTYSQSSPLPPSPQTRRGSRGPAAPRMTGSGHRQVGAR